MAWVSLESLLGEKNLGNIIPLDATVISDVGHPFGVSLEEYNTDSLGIDLCSLVEDKKDVKETLTIKEFIKKHPGEANAFEWNIDNKGFLHLGNIYDLNGTIAYVIVHSLDLRKWIEKQDSQILTSLCNKVTVWNPDRSGTRIVNQKFINGMEEIVGKKFYPR